MPRLFPEGEEAPRVRAPWELAGERQNTALMGQLAEATGLDLWEALQGAVRGTAQGIGELATPPEVGQNMSPEAVMALMELGSGGTAPSGALGALIGRRARTFPGAQGAELERIRDSGNIDEFEAALRGSGMEVGLHGNIQQPEPMEGLDYFSDFGLFPDAVKGADALIEAYPELEGLEVKEIPYNPFLNSIAGYYSGDPAGGPGTINMNSRLDKREQMETMRHELQHFIQGIEGWPSGGNPNMAGKAQRLADDVILELLRDKGVAYPEFFARDMGKELDEEFFENNPDIRQTVNYRRALGPTPQSGYMKIMGELEARAAQRMGPQSSANVEVPGPSGWDVPGLDIGWTEIPGRNIDRSRPAYDKYALEHWLLPDQTEGVRPYAGRWTPEQLKLLQILGNP